MPLPPTFDTLCSSAESSGKCVLIRRPFVGGKSGTFEYWYPSSHAAIRSAFPEGSYNPAEKTSKLNRPAPKTKLLKVNGGQAILCLNLVTSISKNTYYHALKKPWELAMEDGMMTEVQLLSSFHEELPAHIDWDLNHQWLSDRPLPALAFLQTLFPTQISSPGAAINATTPSVTAAVPADTPTTSNNRPGQSTRKLAAISQPATKQQKQVLLLQHPPPAQVTFSQPETSPARSPSPLDELIDLMDANSTPDAPPSQPPEPRSPAQLPDIEAVAELTATIEATDSTTFMPNILPDQDMMRSEKIRTMGRLFAEIDIIQAAILRHELQLADDQPPFAPQVRPVQFPFLERADPSTLTARLNDILLEASKALSRTIIAAERTVESDLLKQAKTWYESFDSWEKDELKTVLLIRTTRSKNRVKTYKPRIDTRGIVFFKPPAPGASVIEPDESAAKLHTAGNRIPGTKDRLASPPAAKPRASTRRTAEPRTPLSFTRPIEPRAPSRITQQGNERRPTSSSSHAHPQPLTLAARLFNRHHGRRGGEQIWHYDDPRINKRPTTRRTAQPSPTARPTAATSPASTAWRARQPPQSLMDIQLHGPTGSRAADYFRPPTTHQVLQHIS